MGAPDESTNRQLVVCLDGTNNTLTAGVKDTNVLQLFEILRADGARRPPGGPEQRLYYDPGVGSVSALPPTGISGFITQPLRRAAGLALGRGVYDNIGQAYLHLCREYGAAELASATSTTDEIYLFGFSRGAFTARAVAGMVNLFGLIRPEHEVLLPTLLRVYFSGDPGPQSAGELSAVDQAGALDDSPEAAMAGELRARAGAAGPGPDGRATMGPAARGLQRMRVALDPVPRRVADRLPGQTPPVGQIRRADVAAQIRREFTSPVGRDAEVYFVGVWDTVDSVGLPGLRKRITSSASVKGKRFRHVRHALALDEHRRQFLPRPYAGTTDPNEPDVDPGQTLKQLWFRGVHTDIGGGRPVSLTRMSSETMHWMVTEARSVGLRCPDVPVATDPLPEVIGDQLRAQPLWALTGMALRDPSEAPAGTLDPPEAALRPVGPRVMAGHFTATPREHPSVADLSPATPGGPPTHPPGSPWARGNGPRRQVWLAPVVVAALLAFFGWALARFELRAGSDSWGLFFSLVFVLGAAGLLARLVARAFGRLTMWRRVDSPWPGWQPTLLGLGYPPLVLGAIGQAVFVVAAWHVGGAVAHAIVLALAALATIAAGIGALLVALLILRWLVRELRPRPRSAA